MTENTQKKPGVRSKALKLFGMILLVLLVPLTMDQLDVDREQLKVVGRIAAGVAGLMFVDGLVAKLMKVVGFLVMLLLIGTVVMVSERQIEMPRLKALFDKRADAREAK